MYAKSCTGFPVQADSKIAACWCTLGAIYKVSDSLPTEHDPDVDDAIDRLLTSLSDHSRQYFLEGEIGDWNDAPGRNQSDVLALFDKAIAAAESQQ